MVKVLYLDQNKWVLLARAEFFPDEVPELIGTYEALIEAVNGGRVILPLSTVTMYETIKINDPERRHRMAAVQSMMSRGCVFRGRQRRLEMEISAFIRKICDLAQPRHDEGWFLSDRYLDAYAEIGDPRLGEIPEKYIDLMAASPAFAMYAHLMGGEDYSRRESVVRYSRDSEQLLVRLEERRSKSSEHPPGMRRRIYSAVLVADELARICEVARSVGVDIEALGKKKPSVIRRLPTEVPTYHIEVELVLKLEQQARTLTANDLRDMYAFCSVLKDSDVVVAEKQFTNLAIQAGLGNKYVTTLTTDLDEAVTALR